MVDDSNGNIPAPLTPQVKAVLTITMFDDGSISVNGPIGDKVLSYGLLESARDAIFEKHLRTVKGSNGRGFIDFIRTKGH